MDLLARLAAHLGSKHQEYSFAEHVLSETFDDVRCLLQHEVEFVREQANLPLPSVQALDSSAWERHSGVSPLPKSAKTLSQKMGRSISGTP
jgi:hypothetical protein